MLFDGQHDAAPFPLSDGPAGAHGPDKEKHGSEDTRQGEQDHPTDLRVFHAVVCAIVEIISKQEPARAKDDWVVDED